MISMIEPVFGLTLGSEGGQVLADMVAAVSRLSPGEIGAAVGALAWATGGLVLVRVLGHSRHAHRDAAATSPEAEATPVEEFRKAA